jgi:uncharacterized protein YjbI with pentapeptide repeats
VALFDEAVWDGVEVTGTFAGQEISHLDVTGCRLIGAIFTGTEIDRLRLADTVVEDCEFSGAVLPRLAAVRVEFRRCRMSSVVAAGGAFTMAGAYLHGSTLDGVRGAEAFKGVTIGSDQVIPLALSLFSALKIRVDDDPDQAG